MVESVVLEKGEESPAVENLTQPLTAVWAQLPDPVIRGRVEAFLRGQQVVTQKPLAGESGTTFVYAFIDVLVGILGAGEREVPQRLRSLMEQHSTRVAICFCEDPLVQPLMSLHSGMLILIDINALDHIGTQLTDILSRIPGGAQAVADNDTDEDLPFTIKRLDPGMDDYELVQVQPIGSGNSPVEFMDDEGDTLLSVEILGLALDVRIGQGYVHCDPPSGLQCLVLNRNRYPAVFQARHLKQFKTVKGDILLLGAGLDPVKTFCRESSSALSVHTILGQMTRKGRDPAMGLADSAFIGIGVHA